MAFPSVLWPWQTRGSFFLLLRVPPLFPPVFKVAALTASVTILQMFSSVMAAFDDAGGGTFCSSSIACASCSKISCTCAAVYICSAVEFLMEPVTSSVKNFWHFIQVLSAAVFFLHFVHAFENRPVALMSS